MPLRLIAALQMGFDFQFLRWFPNKYSDLYETWWRCLVTQEGSLKTCKWQQSFKHLRQICGHMKPLVETNSEDIGGFHILL